ncbi:hypothetical protein LTR37_008100 [Vermiconidia calcicola]|uniref:Uncharacterized protein n=1 Tax=Vermiconidia calcicola TaxID=1690605 RepID=A0ACC3NEK0_9PEZI|nr:hypothetical protein LTR37_008100 [Vermiconidia calcicola]
MTALLDRARSVFRRKPRDDGFDDDNDDQRPISPRVGPNGVVTGRSEARRRPQTPEQNQQGRQNTPQRRPRPQAGDGQQPPLARTPATQSGHLEIALHNDTNSSTVYAYITGQAIDRGNALFLLSADAETPYYPASPPSTGTRLTQNISIDLGRSGNTVYARIPRLAGGRIWFSVGAPLRFTINPGASHLCLLLSSQLLTAK